MAYGIDGKLIAHSKVAVTLDASGNGTAEVVFGDEFPNVPAVLVVPHLGDAGTYAPSSITTTGMVVTVTGSGLRSDTIWVTYFASEKS